MKRFFRNRAAKSLKGNRARKASPKGVGFERVEERCVMMAAGLINPVSNNDLYVGPQTLAPPSSEGSIELNSSNKVLTISASDYGDSVNVSIDSGNVRVSITNIGTPIVKTFTPSSVKSIVFHGLKGNDWFNNRTALPSTASGDDGDDTLLGGSAVDTFFGGAGNDWLDGRLGNDILNGDAGNDLIFGDAGNDTLHGNLDSDTLLGGAGNDSLYGDDGSDQLEGGAGANKMFGGKDADQFRNFVVPKNRKAYSGPSATTDFNAASGDEAFATFNSTFGWMDSNLTDGDLRSLVRLDYQDAVISRTEMLGLYSQIEVDGKVTTAEHVDLLAISRTDDGLNMSLDVRVLSNDVAGYNGANYHYLGHDLGMLKNGDPSSKLDKLVDKWFYGYDLPTTDSSSHYQWVSGNLFNGLPKYTDIVQGAAGDCYFLCTLSEIALKNPTDIQNMFIDNGDGTFAVRFFNNGEARYVTVNHNLPVKNDGTAEYASFGGAYMLGSNVLWVALAEKAYAQMNEECWTRQDATNTYHGIDSGNSSFVIAQITGGTAGFTALNSNSTIAMKNSIIDAFTHNHAVTMTTKTSGTANNVVADHAYALVGFDAATQRFTLYNPWGFAPHNDTQYSGQISLTWDQVLASFCEWETGIV